MTIRKTHELYTLGKLNLLKQDYPSAFWYSYECWESIRELFRDAKTEQRNYLLKLLFQTSMVMTESLKEQDRKDEAFLYLERISETFDYINYTDSYEGCIRDAAYFFKKRVFQEMKFFSKALVRTP